MIYTLKLKNGLCETINRKSFVKNQLKNNKLKYVIYIFRRGKEIVYVGEAGRGLFRCIDGLTANRNQSIAYPWRNHSDIKNSVLQVMVVSAGLPSTMAKVKRSREVVEADVAASIFNATKIWPRKLTAIKIHGGVDRNKSYKNALHAVVSKLKNAKWI
jgi:predicted carbohydrate-binding protein with CBM5 and CBM33 domain